MTRAIPALLLALAPAPAAAWWDYGHQTVARIAEAEMRPETRRRVRALLARSALLETPTCPAATMAQASVWADCVKRLGPRFAATAPWHYQNVPVDRPYDPAAACRDGACVSVQIVRQAALLRRRDVPAAARVEALAWVIHLVGDLHMPLHAGDRGDRGGNDTRGAYGRIPASLHTIWDGHLAERAISTPPAGAALRWHFGAAERRAMRGGDVAAWSRESWSIARDAVYPTPMVDEAAVGRLAPVVRRQIARAGLRLARLLDEALAPIAAER